MKKTCWCPLVLIAFLLGPTANWAQPFPARFELGALAAEDGIKFYGIDLADEAGTNTVFVGDLNHDGLDDVAISAPEASPNGEESGEVYVAYGRAVSPGAEVFLAELDGTDGFRVEGEARGDALGGDGTYTFGGNQLAPAGDLNGDGVDDLLITATSANGVKGRAYVLFGRVDFPGVVQVADLNGTNGFMIDTPNALDSFGRGSASIGDWNGDGFDDIAIGESNADTNGESAGSVYVIFGRSTFPAAMQVGNLSGTNGFELIGGDSYDGVGYALGGGGDYNDDGLADLLVGTSGAPSQFYIVFGRDSDVPAEVTLGNFQPGEGVEFGGESALDSFGESVAHAGDFNGDGIDDLVIGSDHRDSNASSSGSVYVVYGRADFPTELDVDDLEVGDGVIVNGIEALDYLGNSVGGAGDVNADGYSDVIMGGLNTDAAYVVFGGPSQPPVIELEEVDGSVAFSLEGETRSDGTGQYVSLAGDFNGDGVADMITGAPYHADDLGAAYLVYGLSPSGVYLGATGPACPGDITFRSKGLTPGGQLSLYRGNARGSSQIEDGVCAGFSLDLDSAARVADFTVDENGVWRESISLGLSTFCGTPVQLVDLSTCAVSNVTSLPAD